MWCLAVRLKILLFSLKKYLNETDWFLLVFFAHFYSMRTKMWWKYFLEFREFNKIFSCDFFLHFYVKFIFLCLGKMNCLDSFGWRGCRGYLDCLSHGTPMYDLGRLVYDLDCIGWYDFLLWIWKELLKNGISSSFTTFRNEWKTYDPFFFALVFRLLWMLSIAWKSSKRL